MVCQGNKDYCIMQLVVRGIPTVVLGYLLFLHARYVWRAGKGVSKLPLVITAEAFFGSVFLMAALLPEDPETSGVVNSPSVLFWEAGGLTIFLSWRMLHKVIKNLKKYSEKTERLILYFVFFMTGLLLGVLVPLSVLVAIKVLPREVTRVAFYVEVGVAIILLVIALWWFRLLRATLAQHLGDSSHPARMVVRRMLIVIFLLIFVILFICSSLVASAMGEATASVFLTMFSGICAHSMFIYAEWPRAEIKTPSHTQGGVELAEVSRTTSRSTATPLPRTPSNAAVARLPGAVVAPRRESSNPPTQAPSTVGLAGPERSRQAGTLARSLERDRCVRPDGGAPGPNKLSPTREP